MSVSSLIAQFGKTATVKRAAVGQSSNGSLTRSYVDLTGYTAFIQERSSNEQLAQGRTNSRNSTVIYFAGSVTFEIDDLIQFPTTGSGYLYRVTGFRVPDLATSHQNCHTIVDAIRVAPSEAIPT